MTRALLITNPFAARAHGNTATTIRDILQAGGWKVDVQATTGPGDARRIAEEARTGGFDVFVSHGGFFVHLVCVMLDLPWRQASNGLESWFLLNNCSLSRFDINKKEVTICYMNRTDHLPDHLIT